MPAPHPKAGVAFQIGLSYIIRLCQPSSGSFIWWINAVAARLAGAITARRAGRVPHAAISKSGGAQG